MPCPWIVRRNDPEAESQSYIDKLTRMLCEAMHIIDGSEDTTGPAIEQASEELLEWWMEHQRWDRERKIPSAASIKRSSLRKK